MNTILKSIIRLLLCFFWMTLWSSAVSPAQAQHANFSGTWIANTEKSQNPWGPASFTKSMIIIQTDKELVMEVETPKQKFRVVLNLDGTPIESVSPSSADWKRTTRFKWVDSHSFETVIADDVADVAGKRKPMMKDIRITSLSADGKALRQKGTITINFPGQEYHYELVLERVKD